MELLVHGSQRVRQTPGIVAVRGRRHVYLAACEEVVARDYLGFRLFGADGTECNDGIVRRLQPDVQMIDQIALLNLPALESMSVDEARVFAAASSADRPPGPDVGEIVERRRRPVRMAIWHTAFTGRPPPARIRSSRTSTVGVGCSGVCHVRRSAVSRPVRSGRRDRRVRRLPAFAEHRFPAAVDDGMAAVQWIADNAVALGGVPGQLAIGGWSAGGGIAAVVCRLARDAGGPAIVGQALLTPITDLAISHDRRMSTMPTAMALPAR